MDTRALSLTPPHASGAMSRYSPQVMRLNSCSCSPSTTVMSAFPVDSSTMVVVVVVGVVVAMVAGAGGDRISHVVSLPPPAMGSTSGIPSVVKASGTTMLGSSTWSLTSGHSAVRAKPHPSGAKPMSCCKKVTRSRVRISRSHRHWV